MSSTFTPQKQLAFGSIVGGLLRTVQIEHKLTESDLVVILVAMAAGQASVAGWNLESFVQQAARAWIDGVGNVRANVPLPRD